jgi:SAM-dependent methyltransferase
MDWPQVKQLALQAVPPTAIALGRVVLEPRAVLSGPVWHCPLCGHDGRFLPDRGRRWARCWRCGSLERHRLLWHVIGTMSLSEPVLHFAPERAIEAHLRARCQEYQTADIRSPFPVDHPGCDLTALPFPTASFGTLIACHVLEHVRDDQRAIAEIARVLRPGGVAFLPVPIVAARTIEYPQPVASEHYHVRAPGLDYYDRLRTAFMVRVVTSTDAPDRLQTWIHEDRTGWPTPAMPHRLPIPGTRHLETVPVAERVA